MSRLLALVVAVLAGALFLLSRPSNRELEPARPAGLLSVAKSDPRTEVAPLERDTAAHPAPLEVAREEVTAEPDEAVPDGPRVTLVGVVTDESDLPVEGALVQLAAYQTWYAESGTDLASFGPDLWKSMRGFEERTDSAGAFAFDVPVPSAERCLLFVGGERHIDCYEETFGGTGRGSRPPLIEGRRDLGVIRLSQAGAITGRVLDVSGLPIEGVRIGIGTERSTTLGRYANTGPDGRYVIPHAPVGTYGVSTKLEGYLSEFRSPITVEAGRDTGPVDFELERAKQISGRVEASDGSPVENARLWGWPQSSGSGAGTRSKEDGSFIIYLPQDEPYSLEVTHADYVKWGDSSDKDKLYEPGTDQLIITLVPASKTRFRVVDASTNEPIERFGFNILEENGSKATRRSYTERRRPRVKHRPGGEVEVSARAGIDLYVVYAKGYLLATGDVEPDQEDGRVQTIHLQPGATVTGRVTTDDLPFSGVPVELVADFGFGDDGSFRADDNTRQRVETGADGRFEFTGIAGSKVRVTAHPREGAPTIAFVEGLEPPEHRDLGDLVVGTGGSIVGTVLVPPGVDAGGLTVYLGEWSADITQVTDTSGRFRFDGVAVGEHAVWQRGREGLIESGGSVTAAVTEGAVTQVEIDARSFVMVAVELTVEVTGLAPGGLKVKLLREGAPLLSNFDVAKDNEIQLGTTDEQGLVRGSGRAFGPCDVAVRIPDVGYLRSPEPLVELNYGAAVEATVRLEAAALEVECGPGFALPESGTLHIEFEEEGVIFPTKHVKIPISEGRLTSNESGSIEAQGRRATVRGLTPGTWRIDAYATVTDAPNVMTQLPGGGQSFGPERLWEWGAELTLGGSAPANLRMGN